MTVPLTFKIFIYKSRQKHKINLSDLLNSVKKVKMTEQTLCSNDTKKKERFEKKWKITNAKLPIKN